MHAVGGSAGGAAAAAGAAAVAPAQLPAIDATTLTVEPGEPSPLGASPGSAGRRGVNFALWAPAATSVTLCLHDWQDRPIMETLMQRTGDTWHAFVEGLPQVRGGASGGCIPGGGLQAGHGCVYRTAAKPPGPRLFLLPLPLPLPPTCCRIF